MGATGDPVPHRAAAASAGGWLFAQQPDGTWDPARVGLDCAETIAALDQIRMLGELGISRPAVTRLQTLEAFQMWQAAFLLAASGVIVPAREAKVNFAVSSVARCRQ